VLPKDRKIYFVFLISLILTGLAVFDGTPLFVALATIMFPIIASYGLIVKFKIFPGVIFATILWALSIFVRDLLIGSLTFETVKTVSVKLSTVIIFVVVYLFDKIRRGERKSAEQ